MYRRGTRGFELVDTVVVDTVVLLCDKREGKR
jgi:hypothetical protein